MSNNPQAPQESWEPSAHILMETGDGDYVSVDSNWEKRMEEHIAKRKALRAQSEGSATPTEASAEPEIKETPAIFCRMCGKKITGDSKFCMYCGEKVVRE